MIGFQSRKVSVTLLFPLQKRVPTVIVIKHYHSDQGKPHAIRLKLPTTIDVRLREYFSIPTKAAPTSVFFFCFTDYWLCFVFQKEKEIFLITFTF